MMWCRAPTLTSLALIAAAAAGSGFCAAVTSSSVSLLFQNSLNWTSNQIEHPSLLLLEAPVTQAAASSACASLSEQLVDLSSIDASSHSDFQDSLKYQIYLGTVSSSSYVWVATPSSGSHQSSSSLCTAAQAGSLKTAQVSCSQKLPALCTNSAPYSISTDSDNSAKWQISTQSQGKTFTGYRDYTSFRFLGIRYANPPPRWEYSTVYSGSQKAFNATTFGSHCTQGGDTDSSEDCLFLNIFTPYLPASGSKDKLKPVMFWIHGGGYTNGYNADPTFDGGAIASRGDVVLVSINYRLGALGFLALDDGVINGNYGFSDQITALKWIKQNVAAFGGDPNRVTIFGQSAGAGSVRVLLGSPKAAGLFQGAIAQSNLGGSAYATTYSEYLTIPEEAALCANNIISETNCANSDPAAVRACLKAVPAATLVTLADSARYPVVDGIYITSDRLPLKGDTSSVNKVPTMWGWMQYDGAPFVSYPAANVTVAADLVSQGLMNSSVATALVQSGLFPTPNTGNATLDVFNVTARVATDAEFRCLDQATAVAAAKNGVFPETFVYEFGRSYQTPGWSPNFPTCEAPANAQYPAGDPYLPYFQCHSGELYYVFGTLGQVPLPFRDAEDLAFTQYISDTWVAFARNYNPNVDVAWLQARGVAYAATISQAAKSGKWEAVSSSSGNNKGTPLRFLDGVSTKSIGWKEVEQCSFLGYPLTYYE
ncbi:alpha/beta-hydrolase [Clavulina sp. PMI_390]|nr:alpha/beta-hydrolase [Clavulina sp. PMI_390]